MNKMEMDNQDSPGYTNQEWKDTFWNQDFFPWQASGTNPFLMKFHDDFTGGRSQRKWLVPLCGKTLDMQWLLDQGHSVVGIDLCEIPIKDFLNEHDHQYKTEKCSIGTVYKATDANLTFYCADLYKFSRAFEGQFDAIWDRASFGSISPADRQKYMNLMRSLLHPDGVHAIELYWSSKPNFNGGPPYSVTDKTVESFLDDSLDVEVLFRGTRENSELVRSYLKLHTHQDAKNRPRYLVSDLNAKAPVITTTIVAVKRKSPQISLH